MANLLFWPCHPANWFIGSLHFRSVHRREYIKKHRKTKQKTAFFYFIPVQMPLSGGPQEERELQKRANSAEAP